MAQPQLPVSEVIRRLKAIELAEGNISRAARDLGVDRASLAQTVENARKRGITLGGTALSPLDKARMELADAKQTIRGLQREADTAEQIRQAIYNISAHDPEPPAWLIKEGKAGHRGTPMTIWSDWHYGEVVRGEEVGGVNEFNAEVAAKRIKKLPETIIDLAFNHMGKASTKYPGIVVMLGGDMISGDIHQELAESNDRTPFQCVNDLTDLIAGNLSVLADKFGRVFVPCVVGNHGRGTHKPRMKGRIFTSFEWNIYCNLARYFKKDKRVQFYIPEETDAYFRVYDTRFLLTHGDSLGVKGGDGIIGAIGPIMRGALKVGKSESHIGRDFDYIVMGHWHQMLWLPGAIVNNSLKGYDEYARLALRAPYSRPSQALWFVHPEHGVTARWEVFLDGRKSAAPGEWCSWPEGSVK